MIFCGVIVLQGVDSLPNLITKEKGGGVYGNVYISGLDPVWLILILMND